MIFPKTPPLTYRACGALTANNAPKNNKVKMHIEFKAHQSDSIKKDFVKLIREKIYPCMFFHVMENANAGTLPALFKKFNNALTEARIDIQKDYKQNMNEFLDFEMLLVIAVIGSESQLIYKYIKADTELIEESNCTVLVFKDENPE